MRLGRHIDGIVDAYYGPPELARQVEAEPLTAPDELGREAARLREEADGLEDRQRSRFIAAQLDGVAATAERLSGEALSFKEEVRRCYGIAFALERTELQVKLTRVDLALSRLKSADQSEKLTPAITVGREITHSMQLVFELSSLASIHRKSRWDTRTQPQSQPGAAGVPPPSACPSGWS